MKKIRKGSLKIFSKTMSFYRELKTCRICGGEFEERSVRLKDSPLANEIYPDYNSAISADVFPLEIVMCGICSHIQLRYIVNPARLFSNYVYASGTSSTFREHFQQLALRISRLVHGGKILEIGSNDGTLMDSLRAIGFQVVGIEPSATLTKKCIQRGLEVHTDFLNETLSKDLQEAHKEFDVVVGNNVFAHIDDLPGALRLVSSLLSKGGFFVFEVAHSLALVNELLFDTIYHEHMSYHSAYSLSKFMPEFGFEILEIEEIPMHGGSIRVICKKAEENLKNQTVSEAIKELLRRESDASLDTSDWMDKFENRLSELKSATQAAIFTEGADFQWFGYGAPAKAVTFINEFNLGELGIMGIIDDNVDKQGSYLPSSGIKISSRNEMLDKIKDRSFDKQMGCIVFPWNLSSEIVDRLAEFSNLPVKLIWFLPKYKRMELNNDNATG
jgi:2-polyprenyl-3-methyl-5-hydroxy-6-metoxy-1,4-benzoquinol methylase